MQLNISLDPNLSLISAPGCLANGKTLICNIATLSNSATATVQVTATAPNGGNFLTSASVSSDLPDPNAGNNSASSPVNIAIASTAEDTDVPALPDWAVAAMALLVFILGSWQRQRLSISKKLR